MELGESGLLFGCLPPLDPEKNL